MFNIINNKNKCNIKVLITIFNLINFKKFCLFLKPLVHLPLKSPSTYYPIVVHILRF